ncbi:MAG: TRAP transporter fused permease subunit [Pseudomonadota bacterium]|nr:TRAP transporter fused permease subunit [Pseudomonadota bacterium]
MQQVGLIFALILAVAAIYGAGPFPFIEQGIRLGGAIGAAVIVTLTLKPLANEFGKGKPARRAILWLIDSVFLICFVFTLFNFAEVYESMWDGVIILETPTLAVGCFGGLVVIEAVRRTFGLILPTICILMLFYAHYGDLPGILGHKGFTFEEVVEVTWFSFSGVFGRPTDIVSSIVLIFIVFGAMLEATGATGILLKIATVVTARIRGGTAHSAIVASALFGTISGSPVANVVGTGVFTIPMIKRQGFGNSFAGAVEAAASSGGQFTPPIMAAVAFIMAELIGMPYIQVAICAAIPALLYYGSLFASVYAEAVRLGIKPLPKEEIPKLTKKDWLESSRFLVPLFVVVAVLFAGRSAALAGFSALVAAVLTGLVIDWVFLAGENKRNLGLATLFEALRKGGVQCAQIMVAVGSIGIVIGVVSLTGVASNFGALVAELAEGSLFVALLVTAVACLLLGMGLPTLPAYLFIVLFVGPVIGSLGIPALLVHMFVLYFGVLSNVTPPVAIAAYAAAPIAGSNPMSTGFNALRLAAVGFIIPFVMIYYPSISIVIGFNWAEFLWILARMPVAIWLIASALIGCDSRNLKPLERMFRAVCAVVLLTELLPVQIGAYIVGLSAIIGHRVFGNKSRSYS